MACPECEKNEFLVDYLYEALGPANDDILAMAEEEWEVAKAESLT